MQAINYLIVYMNIYSYVNTKYNTFHIYSQVLFSLSANHLSGAGHEIRNFPGPSDICPSIFNLMAMPPAMFAVSTAYYRFPLFFILNHARNNKSYYTDKDTRSNDCTDYSCHDKTFLSKNLPVWHFTLFYDS